MGMTTVGAQRDAQLRMQVGLGVGAVAAARAFTPSVLARSWKTNAMFAVGGLALGFGAGHVLERGEQAIRDHTPLDTSWKVHTAALGLGAAAFLATRGHLGSTLVGGVAHTGGAVLATAAAAGIAIDALHGFNEPDHPDQQVPEGSHLVRNIAIGAAVVGAVAIGAVLAKNIKGQLGHVGQLAQDAATADATGAALGELIPRSKITTPGRMFLEARTTGLAVEPVRTYSPLELDGLTMQQRNARAVESMVAQGAFQRSSITIGVTTGTGGLNNVPIELNEVMSGGDAATVAFQYSKLPSIFSVSKTSDGVAQLKDLVGQIAAKRSELFAAGEGPDLYVTATSLGANVVNRTVKETGSALFDAGVKRAILFGQPQRLEQMPKDILGAGGILRVESQSELAALTADQVSAAKVLSYRHPADPVGLISWRDWIVKPEWMGKVRPEGVPAGMKFTPVGSMLQQANDVVSAITLGSSPHVADAFHDYRGGAEIAVNKGFGHFNLSPEDVQKIAARVEGDAATAAQHWSDVMKGKVVVPPVVPHAPQHFVG